MDIGFYLINVDHSEKNDSIINTINELVDNHPYDNVVLFNSQYDRIDSDKKFPIIHLNQSKYFRGYLVLFDIKSAIITKTFPSPQKQLLYVDDLAWNRDRTIPALFWNSVYANNDIKLLAKNQEIYDIVDLCWSTPVGLMESINSKELYNVISKL